MSTLRGACKRYPEDLAYTLLTVSVSGLISRTKPTGYPNTIRVVR